MDKNKQEEFENRKPIEPIEGQMCYDELLTRESQEDKVEVDTSVVDGQLDLWSLPKEEKIELQKPVEHQKEIEQQIEEEEVEQEKIEDNVDDEKRENSQYTKMTRNVVQSTRSNIKEKDF